MRIVDRHRALLVQDSPGLHWLLGLLFLSVGTLFVLGPLGLFTDAMTVGWHVRALSLVLGAIGGLVGLWVLYRAPRSMLRLDRLTGRVHLVRWGLTGRRAYVWSVAEIAAVHLAESADDEGSLVFQVQLLLRDGHVVPVSQLWTHGRQSAVALTERLQQALEMSRAGGSVG